MTVKKVIIYSVIGFVLTAMIFTGVFYFATNKGDKETDKEVAMETFTYSFGELYSNLKDSKRILKISIVLETYDEKLIETLDTEKFKINNNILELLRSKTEEDLAGDVGQKNLRKEVLESIKSVLPPDKVSDVYFVEFIIQ